MSTGKRLAKRSIIGTRVCAPGDDGKFYSGVIHAVKTPGNSENFNNNSETRYSVRFDSPINCGIKGRSVTMREYKDCELIGPGFQAVSGITMQPGQKVFLTYNGREVTGVVTSHEPQLDEVLVNIIPPGHEPLSLSPAVTTHTGDTLSTSTASTGHTPSTSTASTEVQEVCQVQPRLCQSSISTPSTSTASTEVQEVCQVRPRLCQSSISTFIPKKVTFSKKKELDELLVKMIICDLQPFQIVENKGFKAFVTALNPGYVLPNRHTISKTLIPALHEQCLNKVKNMMETVKKVCITTDCWTSINNESFLAITAHFLTDNFELKSVLLECCVFEGSHTSENLSEELNRTIQEYRLENKILLAVSDNAANIKRAITDLLQLKHFGCFAHQLNIIVTKAIQIIDELLNKIKTIVKFFKRSSQATEKLLNFQRNSGCTQAKKVILDVATRWNSTLYMLERFCELEDAIKSTTALVDRDLPVLTSQEWKVIHEMCKILKPLEIVTKAASGEKYISGSLVIVLANGLQSVYDKFSSESFTDLSEKVIKTLSSGLKERFDNIEDSNTFGLCTLLDPRFKSFAFQNQQAMENCKKKLQNLIASRIRCLEGDKPMNTIVESKDEFSPWSLIDQRLSQAVPQGTPTSRAIIEVQRYFECDILSRTEDALKWWCDHKIQFPFLCEIAQEYLCISCTSVPCERVFSKGSLLFNDKRTRLHGRKAQQILLLNSNLQV